MAKTPPGQMSAPVQTQYGWHILKVEDRREKDVTDQATRAKATDFVHQRKYEEELDAWLQQIRDEAFVDIK
jgi:peptidyl-prolyl cis-trans isomerase SurA